MITTIPGGERYEAIQNLALSGLAGETLLSSFRYAKIKGNSLFFVFGHPAGKQEFPYKKEAILGKMRKHYRYHKTLLRYHNIAPEDIHAVVIHKRPPQGESPSVTEIPEAATGEFKIQSNNPALVAIFEKIQRNIKGKK